MAIVNLQMRARRLGEIRLGDTVTRDGKTYPISLDTFRLTSVAKELLDKAAALWGGEVKPWQQKWQVTTNTSELPVYVSPQDPDSLTYYELWSAAGLQRRCDGEQILNRGEPTDCACDPDNRECSMVTRLQVMLPDLPDVGVWTLSSTGFYAATELAMSIQIVMQSAQTTGALPQAVLAIERRELKKPGKQTRKFVVPVLRFSDSLGSFMEQSEKLSLPGSVRSLPGESDGSVGDGGAVQPSPSSPPAATIHIDKDDVEGSLLRGGLEDWVEQVAGMEPEPALPPTEMLSLLSMLEETPDEGTMGAVQNRVYQLFRGMADAGLWGEADAARRATLKGRYGTTHLTELRKDELNQFAVLSFDAAKKKIGEADDE